VNGNCIRCLRNERDGRDLLCAECRATADPRDEQIRRPRPPGWVSPDMLRSEQVETLKAVRKLLSALEGFLVALALEMNKDKVSRP